MRFDAILFDLDGTLTASEEGITNSVRYAFEKMGVPSPDASVLRRFIGPPLVGAFMEFGGMTEEEARRATEYYRERFREIGWRENRVYVGIPEMLMALKAQGVRLAVASSKPQVFVEKILKHFGLAPFFESVAAVTMENTDADKSSLIRRAIPQGLDFSRACMVGDRCFDMEAAKKTGLYAVGAAYGYGSREELFSSGADAVANGVPELRDILLGGSMPRAKGRFVTFEGLDGCGKSTQLRKTQEYLTERGWETLVSREPGGCGISERVREILLDVGSEGMSAQCEALLYAAARAEHVRNVIEPALQAGKIVLCDRFLDSSIAYQGYGRELGEDFVRQINESAVHGLEPDRTFLFELPEETAKSRVLSGETAPDRLEAESMDFFARVRAGYQNIALRDMRRVVCVDAKRDIESVFQSVLTGIDQLLETM